MLSRLYIKNIALISEADIFFDEGFNVLSGETGSGKSVILDSINFVLGSKADKTMIRYGEQEAVVRAEFSVSAESEALAKLAEMDIESEGEIIITRKFSIDGKSSIKINGNSVTSAMLKQVTQHLVDVHGQSEHFFLLSEENQLKVIDGICGGALGSLKVELSELLAEKRGYNQKISELGGDSAERERKIDLLDYQINEIESAEIQPGEFEKLKEKQIIIVNTEKIYAALNAAYSALSDDEGAGDSVSTALHCVKGISALSEKYNEITSRLEELGTEVSDISETIRDLAEDLTFDEREAQKTDERLTLIKSIMRKYGGDEKSVLDFLAAAKSEYDLLINGAEALEKYNKAIKECNEKIYSLCLKMTAIRKKSADAFCKKVADELKTLNIKDAQFEAKFVRYDYESANLQSPDGSDKVAFMFSANRGEPLKPLNKVISGGEMSRVMLAIKTQIKTVNGISTYIFDEIDAGISGFTAKSVADKFKKIAENTQIIAVSHLPQVCAASNAQFLIYKTVRNDKTLTNIKKLNRDEKIGEIMRLTGNVTSAAAREHAIELIKQFEN